MRPMHIGRQKELGDALHQRLRKRFAGEFYSSYADGDDDEETDLNTQVYSQQTYEYKGGLKGIPEDDFSTQFQNSTQESPWRGVRTETTVIRDQQGRVVGRLNDGKASTTQYVYGDTEDEQGTDVQQPNYYTHGQMGYEVKRRTFGPTGTLSNNEFSRWRHRS